MTNLIATITFALATNWTTTARITPTSTNPTLAVYITPSLRQSGQVVTNTIATFYWKGTTNSIVLEQTPMQNQPPLVREVPEELDLRKWFEALPPVIIAPAQGNP